MGGLVRISKRSHFPPFAEGIIDMPSEAEGLVTVSACAMQQSGLPLCRTVEGAVVPVQAPRDAQLRWRWNMNATGQHADGNAFERTKGWLALWYFSVEGVARLSVEFNREAMASTTILCENGTLVLYNHRLLEHSAEGGDRCF